MTADYHDHLFSTNFIILKLLASAYVFGLIVSHAVFPKAYVWEIAVFFSVAMNFTYPFAAVQQGKFLSTEVLISLGLIGLSLAALFVSPLCVVAAIFLHGVWDLAKHNGAGASFFQ